jgi:IclR family transcriptional regulator, acetate operon repressor
MTPTASNQDSGSSTQAEAKGASVISNVFAVLRCFSVEEPLLGVTEIASRVGLHKSTVSRILAMLEQEDVVERDEISRRFRLGMGIIAVAGPLLADLDVRRIAYPVLRELAERTRETASLLVWTGSEAVSVEQIPSKHQIKHTSDLGTRYPQALSASVQVFLASEGAERAKALLQSSVITYPALDEASLEAYLVRLEDVAARGYATNYGETSIEEVGIAAPVYDHRGDVAASVLVSAPRFRVSTDQLQALAESCAKAARDITSRMGGAWPTARVKGTAAG